MRSNDETDAPGCMVKNGISMKCQDFRTRMFIGRLSVLIARCDSKTCFRFHPAGIRFYFIQRFHII